MSENIKKDLAQAKKNYQSKKYEDAKDLYDSLYMDHPEAFTIWDKRFYSWALYQLYVKNRLIWSSGYNNTACASGRPFPKGWSLRIHSLHDEAS